MYISCIRTTSDQTARVCSWSGLGMSQPKYFLFKVMAVWSVVLSRKFIRFYLNFINKHHLYIFVLSSSMCTVLLKRSQVLLFLLLYSAVFPFVFLLARIHIYVLIRFSFYNLLEIFLSNFFILFLLPHLIVLYTYIKNNIPYIKISYIYINIFLKVSSFVGLLSTNIFWSNC